jgi:hypothetical protein
MGSLFSQSWKQVMAWLSTSMLSVILFSVLVPFATFGISAVLQWRAEGRRMPLTRVLTSSILPTAIAFGITLLILILLFFAGLIAVILQARRASAKNVYLKEAEINALKEELRTVRETVSFVSRANLEVVYTGFPRDPFEPGQQILVNVRFKNIGPIPASKVALACRIGIARSSPNQERIDDERADHESLFARVRAMVSTMDYGNNSVMPGKENFVTVAYPLVIEGEVPLTANEVADIKNKAKSIAIAGIFKYMDDYGKREMHFCYCFHGSKLEANAWNDCFNHNEIL